jgi:polygalacturonase
MSDKSDDADAAKRAAAACNRAAGKHRVPAGIFVFGISFHRML